MNALDRNVTLLDVTTRDGLQDEPCVVATAQKLKIVEALIETGISDIEVTSFVHPVWVPQLADAEGRIVLEGNRDHGGDGILCLLCDFG